VSITLNLSFASVPEMRAALAEMLAGITPPAVAPTPAAMDKALAHAAKLQAVAEEAKAPKQVKAEKSVATPTANVTATTEKTPEVSAPKEVATESPSDVVVDYAVVSKAITNMVKTDREKVVALLAKYGAKKGTELKAEQYVPFMTELVGA